MHPESGKMDSRKTALAKRTDLLVIAGLLPAVAVAAFLDHRYLGFYAWALAAVIAIFAYWIGVRVGMKRGTNGHPHV
jgi:hypothetical protein